MGSVLFPRFKAGMSAETAWRTVSIVSACVAFLTGFTILGISDDCPKGNYKDMKVQGVMQEFYASASFRTGALNLNTWFLFIQYGSCFGVELTMVFQMTPLCTSLDLPVKCSTDLLCVFQIDSIKLILKRLKMKY
jgi:nitrate/nitrite transporter NarK